jgi:hypothetical protein
MLCLPDRASIESASTASLPTTLATALAARIRHTLAADLADFTHILVVEAEDTEAQVIEAIGFSPRENSIQGTRHGHPTFLPGWAWLVALPGCFEMIVTVGDSGFASIILIEDAHVDRSGLATMCRFYGGSP